MPRRGSRSPAARLARPAIATPPGRRSTLAAVPSRQQQARQRRIRIVTWCIVAALVIPITIGALVAAFR
jgi:hypothetical protein